LNPPCTIGLTQWIHSSEAKVLRLAIQERQRLCKFEQTYTLETGQRGGQMGPDGGPDRRADGGHTGVPDGGHTGATRGHTGWRTEGLFIFKRKTDMFCIRVM
jgi:hypothetical protein